MVTYTVNNYSSLSNSALFPTRKSPLVSWLSALASYVLCPALGFYWILDKLVNVREESRCHQIFINSALYKPPVRIKQVGYFGYLNIS